MQRARFGLWGESVGLVPDPLDGKRLRYDKNLDRPDIRPGVERILNNTKSLLDEANRVDDRYGSKLPPESSSLTTSRGVDIFKGSFERFKSRIRKNQKEASAWKVTRWAIHDSEKFEVLIDRLKDFVDGLESITTSLGLLEKQRAKLREEIESISDTQSLRLLRDASSRHGSSDDAVSDTASQRLLRLTGSYTDSVVHSASTGSYVTVRTHPSATTDLSLQAVGPIMGLSARTNYSDTTAHSTRHVPGVRWPKKNLVSPPSCESCQEEHYRCVSQVNNKSCSRCIQKKRVCSLLATVSLSSATMYQSSAPSGVPQNQRLLTDLLSRRSPRTALTFEMGDTNYGDKLQSFKIEDSARWAHNAGKLIIHADGGSVGAKRMFLELRDMRLSRIPFISAAPVSDRLDRVLASIEGPPETPYQGGVFWLTINLSQSDPYGPPLIRFHTKIYHPNISPQGHICADYKDKWNAVLAASFRMPAKGSSAAWFSAQSKQPKWSLGSLLTALCGLLASPDVDDPLVPEIAMKYLEDYDGYYENARLYTERWAIDSRPDEANLVFLEEEESGSWGPLEQTCPSQDSDSDSNSIDNISIQNHWHEIYDESAPGCGSEHENEDEKDFLSRVTVQQSKLSPLEELLDYHSMSEGWKQTAARFASASQSTLMTTLMSVLRGLMFTSAPAPGYTEFIHMARDQLDFALKPSDGVTDIQICHTVLEMAARHLERDLYEFSPFYADVRQICNSYLSRLLATGTVHVSEPNVDSPYVVTIMNPGEPDWVLDKSWEDFVALNAGLTSHLPGARLWGLDGQSWNSHHTKRPTELEPDPLLMGRLLKFALMRIFLSHAEELLKIRQVLALLRPRGKFDGIRHGLITLDRGSMQRKIDSSPFSGISLKSFLPPRAFESTAVLRLTDELGLTDGRGCRLRTRTPTITRAELWLDTYSFHTDTEEMFLMLKTDGDDTATRIYIKGIENVCSSQFPLPASVAVENSRLPLFLSFACHLSMESLDSNASPSLKIKLVFTGRKDHQMWFSILQLLSSLRHA